MAIIRYFLITEAFTSSLSTNFLYIGKYIVKDRFYQVLTANGSEGMTEKLKAKDPIRWVGLMNNLKACAEEGILSDLIYA